MSDKTDTSLRPPIWRAAALQRALSAEKTFTDIASFGDGLDIELYRPVGVDRQNPHDRDELYFIASGTGTFLRGDERVQFAAGDMLFVPAHVEHRFESFTDDFCTWVVFFGPEKKA